MTQWTDTETKERMRAVLEEASAQVDANREWADAVKENWQKTLDNAEATHKRAMDAEEQG